MQPSQTTRSEGAAPAGLVRDVVLRDGAVLRLRSPTPADEAEIRAFFEGLDLDLRYLRFLGFGRVDTVTRAYAEADGETRVALLAHHGAGLVAVAGYGRLRDPVAAEVAFAISRPFQRRGLGMRMLELLAGHAASQGIERFEAEVLGENQQLLRFFRVAGFDVRHERGGGEVTLVLAIRPTEQLADRIVRRGRVASVASLRPLLAPRSVAVVGASAKPGSVGGQIMRKIVNSGFKGVVWPVNRSGGLVCAMRAVRGLAELPAPPELAVIAVPAAEVAGVVEEAGRVGVRAVLVVSAGFADAGDEGSRREAQLLEVVHAWGIRLVGPNSLGLANTAPGVCLHAVLGDARPPLGGVAISSQSGALGLALLGLAEARGVGVASFVAIGNAADVSPNDLLEYWEDDEAVTAIMLYVESFGDLRRFAQIAQRVSRRKPILAVKGRLARGVPAPPRADTGASLMRDAAFNALFRHCAVLQIDRADELFDVGVLLDREPLPRGRNVGVVTNAGGLGTLAVEASLSRGLSVPPLSSVTRADLEAALPSRSSVANPVDLTVYGGPREFATAVAALLGDVAIDAVVAVYIPVAGGDAEAVHAAVAQAAVGTQKPTVAAILSADGQPPALSGAERVPNLRLPEACVAALAHAADRREWLSRPLGQPPSVDGIDADRGRELVAEALARDGEGWIDLCAAGALLETYGIALAPTYRCADPDEAVAAAAGLDAPVVLKVSSPAPAHAAGIGGVLLGLTSDNAIRGGWLELNRRLRADKQRRSGVVIAQPLIAGGADVLVRAVTDPDLGPVLGLGLGGRQAALSQGVGFRLPPRTDADADELITAATGVSAWLDGYRGSPPVDRLALRDLILRFSRLLADIPELVEVDLTPVRVMRVGCCVLDARMRVAPPTAPPADLHLVSR